MSLLDTFWVLGVEALCFSLFVSGPIGAVMYANRNRSPMAGYLLGAVPLVGWLIVALTKPLPATAAPAIRQAPVQPLRQTAPVNGNAAPGSAMQKLSELKQLADSGLITQEEFTRTKADILARM